METRTYLVAMTITGFTKTLRALDQSGTRTVVWWFLAAVVLAGALGTWMTLGRVQLDEISEEARIEIDGSAFVVQAPVTGRVIRVNYALGQAVAAGAVLVEIDSGRERLQVNEEQSRTQAVEPELLALRNEIGLETSAQEVERRASRAALDEARAKIQETDAPRKLAERERARTEELSQAGLAPKRDVERAASELERLRTVAATAQSAIARIETEQDKREKEREIRIAAIRSKIAKLEGDRQTFGAGVKRAQQDVANRQILAPIAGRIGEAPVLLPGSVLKEGDRIVAIVPAGGLRMVAQFPPAAAHGRIRPGQKALMRLRGYPWAEFGVVEGEVTAVASEDRDAKVRVELAVASSPSLRIPLRHGLPGALEVQVEKISPLTLLLRQSGQWLKQGRGQ